MEVKQRISVKAIICQKGKVLMVQDRAGRWELPGGQMEADETPEGALRRELREELNVEIKKIGKLIHAWTLPVVYPDRAYQYLYLVYECSVGIDEIKISDEHLAHDWIALASVDTTPSHEGYKESIRRYIELR